MTWFKVDDGFATSRPILAIPRRYRAAAAGLWVLAGTWSAKELTDGFIPDYLIDELASTPAIARHLVTAGLWEDAPAGYQLIGWAKYQFTKEQVLARRKVEAEKKQRARDAARKAAEQRRGNYVPDGVPEGHDGESLGESLGESALPDPTRPDPTRPINTLVALGGEVTNATRDDPPLRCIKHINEVGPVPPCRGCATARETHEAWKTEQAAEAQRAKADRRAMINNCLLCDDNGMTENRNGLTRCDHSTVLTVVSNA
jgi:hypothetical protein